MIKTLLTGAGGQLGNELRLKCPDNVELVALTHRELDISRREDVLDRVAACQPDVIINAAAYTAVEGAEAKPDLAVEVNAEGPGHLARAAERCGARLLQVSTDFVFDGESAEPYRSGDETRPLGVYGHSKLAGECRVREILPTRSLVLRTSRVYSRFGGNFVTTMLRLLASRDELRVVSDQVGSPTWARGLAATVWSLLEHPASYGIYHWTDAGQCSWYEFASEIQSQAFAMGLLQREIPIEAVPAADYPTTAPRPAFTALDLSTTEKLIGRDAVPWQQQLHEMLEDLKQHPDPADRQGGAGLLPTG